MATPEQNALFLMQLFGNATAPLGRMRDQRIELEERQRQEGIRALQFNREEQLRRDLARDQYEKALELAGLQADREDKRSTASLNLQKLQTDAALKRQEETIEAAEKRQKAALDAAEVKQLKNAITSAYPKYAAEATKLGEKVRPIREFSETFEGLGDLQAEMARLEQTRVLRDQDATATAVVGELDDANKALTGARTALEQLQKPTNEDITFARTRAVDTVREALASGGLQGAPKPNSDAAKKGLAALTKGNVVEAERLLGSEVIGEFQNAVQTALMAAPNYKGRMQQVGIAQQNYQTAQRNLSTIQSDLRRASATNNSLATRLTERRSGLQSLQMPGEEGAPPATQSFDEIFRVPAAGAALPAGPAIGSPVAQPPTSRAEAPSYFDFNTLTRVPGAAPEIIDTNVSGQVARGQTREAIGDTMRGMGYGITNLFRPSNWTGNMDAIVYTPEANVLQQLQSRLAALRDQTSPTAQNLRNQIERLQMAGTP